MSASHGTAWTGRPAVRRRIYSSVLALLVAGAIVVFVLGRGPGSLVWFNGSSPTWLPFAGSGLSWLPFGHQNQTPQPGPDSTPPAVLPTVSPGPSDSPSPSPSPSVTPTATPAPTPTATPTATPTPAPTSTPYPTPTPTPNPTPAPGPLAASATASPTSGPGPLSVTFSGSASGGTGTYTDYYWDFGDGGMASGQTTTHVYSTRGDYVAILKVYDSAGATATSTVLVAVTLGLTVSATPSSGLAPLAVAIDGAASGGTTPYVYAWDFGDLTTATGLAAAAQSHAYNIPGSYTATLTVTDAGAVSALKTVVVTAQQPVPTVGGISPNAGPETGGTFVTITGTYLMNVRYVKFGGTQVLTADLGVPNCDANADCTLIVNSPPRPAGPVEVRVTTDGGTSAPGNGLFTYLLNWITVTAAPSPTAREGAAMVNDGSGVLLFGGFNGTGLLNDSWYWNGTTWAQVTTPPATTPAARSNAAIAYNGSKVVLFGGACGFPVATTTCYLNDTWTWDPTTRTWASVTGAGPSARAAAMMAKDSSGKLLLFGGKSTTGTTTTYLADSWGFNGTTWVMKAVTGPTMRAYSAMATDTSGQVVLFGGFDGAKYLSDTWKWSGTAWGQAATLAQPSGRKMASLSLFYHPNGGTALGLALFGGRDASSDQGDTWTWNGYSWTQISAAGPTEPPIRSDAMAAMDSTGSVFLFGGSKGGALLSDNWRLS